MVFSCNDAKAYSKWFTLISEKIKSTQISEENTSKQDQQNVLASSSSSKRPASPSKKLSQSSTNSTNLEEKESDKKYESEEKKDLVEEDSPELQELDGEIPENRANDHSLRKSSTSVPANTVAAQLSLAATDAAYYVQKIRDFFQQHSIPEVLHMHIFRSKSCYLICSKSTYEVTVVPIFL